MAGRNGDGERPPHSPSLTPYDVYPRTRRRRSRRRRIPHPPTWARGEESREFEEKGEIERAPRRRPLVGAKEKRGSLKTPVLRRPQFFVLPEVDFRRGWTRARSRVGPRSPGPVPGPVGPAYDGRRGKKGRTAKAPRGGQKFRGRAPPKTTPLPEHAFFKARGGGF